jgi:hypothetical protein
MPIFEKPPLETLTPAKDRWTPIYLEHGRLEVDDLYKEIASFPAAFQAIRQDPEDKGELTRTLLKERIEQEKLLQRMPKDLEELIQ